MNQAPRIPSENAKRSCTIPAQSAQKGSKNAPKPRGQISIYPLFGKSLKLVAGAGLEPCFVDRSGVPLLVVA